MGFVATASLEGYYSLVHLLAVSCARRDGSARLVHGVIGITSTLAMVVMTILTSRTPLVDVPLATVGAGLGWLLGQNDALRRLSNRVPYPPPNLAHYEQR